jgi:hypothetical protein
MIHITTPIILKERTPVAKGGNRLVYEHPLNPALLIKVMRPEVSEGRYGEKASWHRRERRGGEYILFLREIREYVVGCVNSGRSLPFTQKIIGLVDTDIGMGLVVEAARGADGNLAPTAAKLIATGNYDEKAEQALEEFVAGILESDVILSDLHERNIVYTRSQDGGGRFVMIDGLGASTFLSFKSWSRAINERSKRKRIERLRKRIAGRVEAFKSGNPIP